MRSDLTKVRQILFNLISNANKFTENGLVRLQVRREDRAGKDWLVVRVSDDGIGMSQEQQQRLFEAFIQADASTTRRYGGTGLELAISRRLARMPGGDIQVERALSQGATFSPPSHLKRRRRGPAGGSRWGPKADPRRVRFAPLSARPAAAQDRPGTGDRRRYQHPRSHGMHPHPSRPSRRSFPRRDPRPDRHPAARAWRRRNGPGQESSRRKRWPPI